MAAGRSKVTNADVLCQQEAWPSLEVSGTITKEQLALIFKIDKQPMYSQMMQFNAHGSEYVQLFTALLGGVSREETIKYVLALLDELLVADPRLATHFHKSLYDSKGASDPFAVFMKLLPRDSQFILEKASALLGKLLAWAHFVAPGPEKYSEEVLSRHRSTFAEWLMVILKAVDPADGLDSPKIASALNALQQLLSSHPGRSAVLLAEGLPTLVGLMCGGSHQTHSAVQLVYQVIFSLWSLSYSPDGADAMVATKLGVVTKLVDIAKNVQKEKVVRVALATLKNLLGVNSASADMVGAGMVKVLEHLHQRKWADEDVVVDIEALTAALQVDLRSMSSWDVYAKEVASGRLEWSPSHKSVNFWKDNYRSFEAHDFAVAKQLVALLSAKDGLTLAIACHDIAEFVKIHPEGRRLMTQYAAKGPAMQLLKHSDPDVQKYALTAVQRLMVLNWELMAKA